MNILEKEIEDMIWQGLEEDRRLLVKKGLVVWSNASYHRQVDFGSYGICDIMGLQVNPKERGYRTVNAHIIEIKKEEINSATFFQALRYAKAITRLVERRLKNTTCICGITLIGKTVDTKSDFIYLPDIIYNVALYTYKLNFKLGIFFQKESEYFITDEKFADPDYFNWSAIQMVSQSIKCSKTELPI